MNEANRQRLRYSEISTKPGIDSTIEVSLLRRQLMLRKRNIERESLEQQMAILDKVKLSTPAIEEKIAAVELSKLAQHANNQFQKHRLAWREENARLQKWRAFLESDLRDGVASFFRAACDDPAAYVDAVRQIADQEVSDDSELDKERADIHAKLQALAGMLVAEKSAKRDLGEKAIAGLRARIDALKQELNSLVAEDDRRIARLEEDIAAATPTAHATSIEDLQLQDPWVQFDGSVQKLSAVESVDPILTARCRADVLRLVSWFKEQMHHLHTSYADVTSDKHDGWPPMQHARFEKLRGEYPPEMRGRHALWLERARMEFPRFTVKQIEAHEAWTARQIAYKSRRRSLRNAFRQHMDALVHLTLQQYAEASQVYAVHAAQMCDREERLHRLEATQDKLKRWRDQRVQQLRLAAEQRHRAIEAQLELEHARAEHETRRRAAERERIAAYFAHKQALVAKQLEAAKRVEAALALEREARRPVNEERVALRESLRLQKIEERKAAVEEARERQRELERQLDALRRTVAVDAKSDWGRILADTTATAEHKKPVDEPDWFKNYSFSTESVLKDKRAQLSVALHRHGLQGNEYARQILAAMQPKHARPEQASSVQLG